MKQHKYLSARSEALTILYMHRGAPWQPILEHYASVRDEAAKLPPEARVAHVCLREPLWSELAGELVQYWQTSTSDKHSPFNP